MNLENKFTLFILYFSLSPVICLSQYENISFEHFTTDNGLSSPVTEIKQDHFGFLWLGTTDGLNRFDGKNFIVYRNVKGDSLSILHNIINDLCIDKKGRVWLATNGGICYYNFSDDAFHSISYNDSLEKIDRYRVHAVTSGGDEVWFASKTMLHMFKENVPVKSYLLPESSNLIVKYLYYDSNERVWIGTNYGIIVFDTRRQKFFETTLASPFSKSNKLSVTVHPIVKYDGDTLFAGTWYADLNKVYFSGDSIHSILITNDAQQDPRSHIVTGIAKDRSYWWIGTYGNGISLYDAKTNKFVNHIKHDPSNSKSLSNDYVNFIYTDASGIVWIGTSSGLDKFDPLTQQFKSVPIPSMPGEFSVYRLPSTIIQDSKDPEWLWITVSGLGLLHFNKETHAFERISHVENNPSSLPDNNSYSFSYDSRRRIWVGSKTGVSLFDESKRKFFRLPFHGDDIPASVHEILEDARGDFWFATSNNGIYSYDEEENHLESFRYSESTDNSLPDNRVFSMISDRIGRIWIGTQNQGLCFLDPVTKRFTYFRKNRNDPNSLPDNGVYDLYEDKNHLWIATENGLAVMNLDDFRIRTFTTKDGLCNNDVFSITPDDIGNLWLGTNNGLSCLDPLKMKFKNYYRHDGLPAYRIDGAVYHDGQGNLFLGSGGMLSYCVPREMKLNMHVPHVVLTNYKIFDRKEPAMREGEMLTPIHLSYRQNMITFEFAALNFTNSIFNQYAYRLEGFDKEWINCGNRQSATYTNLDGGEYLFRVKAANNDGIWNEKGTHVMLIVSTPWWKTWWFYLLCLTGIAGILYAVYRIRINQLIQLQNIRMRISRDLHDDIGSTLSSINMISSMAKGNGPSARSGDHFRTISSASQQAMELMNDIVWSINPKNDQMEMIVIRIRQYASETLEAAGISFTLDMDEDSKGISLPVEMKKNFYLVFKEAVNNLAKYSQAKNASISINKDGHMLTLTVRDDGIGFQTDKMSNGNGLKNMRARAAQLRGSITIVSGPGDGTVVRLSFPVT